MNIVTISRNHITGETTFRSKFNNDVLFDGVIKDNDLCNEIVIAIERAESIAHNAALMKAERAIELISEA